MIKILVTSDLHGNLPNINEEFDLLMICGDICPAHDHYYAYQIEWIEYEFINWVNTLPFKNDDAKVVITWGNHDFIGEQITDKAKKYLEELTNNRLKILNFEEYVFPYTNMENMEKKNIRIFGTPYCKTFGNWAFMRDMDILKEKYENIPENIDILITHDAPTLGNLGLIQEGRNNGVMAGNTALDDIILKRKPKYVFCGHIHTGNHNLIEIEGVKMANVAYINEYYRPQFDIFKFEL